MIACFAMPQIGLEVERERVAIARGEPLGLVGQKDTLLVVSEGAAPFGIRPGQTASGARVLCPGIRILPYDREIYEEAARAVWDLFAIESSVVEPVSPEVCYVELTGRDIAERAQLLVDEAAVRAKSVVYCGLARTKFVAQQSAYRAGGCKVLSTPRGREPEFLSTVAAANIPGLDEKLKQRLDRLGIRTLGDLQKLSQRDMQRQFKQLAFRLQRLAVGEDGEKVRAVWPPRVLEKAVVFEDEVEDTARIHEALHRCAEGVAVHLTGRHEYCRALALWVTLTEGGALHQHEKLSLPLSDARHLQTAALRLMGRMTIARPISGVRLQAADIGSGSGLQLALLDLNDHGVGLPHERVEALNKTMSYLGKRYGIEAVLPASTRHKPRRISLWTDSLGRMVDEPLKVTTDAGGTPLAYYWHGAERPVERILDRWREEDWLGNAERSTRTVYLVQTASAPFAELIRSGEGWRLGSRFD